MAYAVTDCSQGSKIDQNTCNGIGAALGTGCHLTGTGSTSVCGPGRWTLKLLPSSCEWCNLQLLDFSGNGITSTCSGGRPTLTIERTILDATNSVPLKIKCYKNYLYLLENHIFGAGLLLWLSVADAIYHFQANTRVTSSDASI